MCVGVSACLALSYGICVQNTDIETEYVMSDPPPPSSEAQI